MAGKMIQIANKKTFHGHGEYVGRGSVLGNQWSHKKGTQAKYVVPTREDAIRNFKEWLPEAIKNDKAVADEINRLTYLYGTRGHLTLICWCVPESCHAEIIRDVIYERVKIGNYDV